MSEQQLKVTMSLIKSAFERDLEYTSKIALLRSGKKVNVIVDNEQGEPTQALIESLFLIADLLAERVSGPLQECLEMIQEISHEDLPMEQLAQNTRLH